MRARITLQLVPNTNSTDINEIVTDVTNWVKQVSGVSGVSGILDVKCINVKPDNNPAGNEYEFELDGFMSRVFTALYRLTQGDIPDLNAHYAAYQEYNVLQRLYGNKSSESFSEFMDGLQPYIIQALNEYNVTFD